MNQPQQWTPPDGLGYSRLRAVSLTGLGIALVILSVALLLGAIAAGAALGIRANREATEHRLLRDQGVSTDAVVTRLWRGRDDERTPWVAYRFTSRGRGYEGRAKAPLRIWQGLAEGSPLPVRLLPGNPARNHPTGWPDKPMPPWLPYLLAAILASASCLCALALRRQQRLLSEGRPAPGVVTGRKKTKDGEMVYYEFALLSGAVAKGRGGPVKRPPAMGGPVCVLYDPDNPRTNALYPLSLVKLTKLLNPP